MTTLGQGLGGLVMPKTWRRFSEYEWNESARMVLPVEGTKLEQIELPSVPLWPRLLNLDVTKPDEIIDFIQAWGPLKWIHRYGSYEGAEFRPGFERIDEFVETILPTHNVMPESMLGLVEGGVLYEESKHGRGESLFAFGFGALLIKQAGACLQALESDFATFGASLPSLPPASVKHDAGSREWETRQFANDVINSGLQDVTAGFSFTLEGAGELTVAPRTLFALCCLELARHIAGGHEIKVCANETCQKPTFVFHKGRTRKGSPRSDAKYCSKTCTQQQVQREYRRRKKEKG